MYIYKYMYSSSKTDYLFKLDKCVHTKWRWLKDMVTTMTMEKITYMLKLFEINTRSLREFWKCVDDCVDVFFFFYFCIIWV